MMIALLLVASLATPQECAHIGPLYWEIGDANGTLEYGLHGSGVHSESILPAGFATSWLFAAYVAETRKVKAADEAALRMTSGYSGLAPKACLEARTVEECMGRAGELAEGDRGKPVYDAAHLQHWAVEHGLEHDAASRLAERMRGALGLPLEMRAPLPATGGFVSAAGYAAFLRKLLSGTLRLSAWLGKDPAGDVARSPAPRSWRWSYGHFVEDDGALSNPGASGFYPWISGKTYGLVARRSTSRQALLESVECGRALRRAFAAERK
jgi:hypothetical protein